jgi:DNA modification methylase
VFENEVDLSTLKKEDMLKILQEFQSAQGTIIRQDKPRRNDVHPTMKPIPLMALLIKNSTVSGELVADPFLGSGSTMVAAHQIGRICYGMELDPKYCQVIIERMHLLDETLEIKINGTPWAQN